MTMQIDPDALIAQCNRQLDGMTVNCNQIARNTIALAEEVKNWRAAFDRLKSQKANAQEGFSSAFNDIFKGFGL